MKIWIDKNGKVRCKSKGYIEKQLDDFNKIIKYIENVSEKMVRIGE